jgi:hypothetical protein
MMPLVGEDAVGNGELVPQLGGGVTHGNGPLEHCERLIPLKHRGNAACII